RRLYAIVLSQTAGYAADPLLENLTRTQAIADKLGDAAARFDALNALCLLHANSGDLPQADELGGDLSRAAEHLEASAHLQSRVMRGARALWRGNLKDAAPLLAAALASPAPPADADQPYGVNPVVAARSFEVLRRWAVGDPAGARDLSDEALALAEAHGRPFTLAHAMTFAAILHSLDARWEEAAGLVARVVDLSEDYGFPLWRGAAPVIRGRARAPPGGGERGPPGIPPRPAPQRARHRA